MASLMYLGTDYTLANSSSTMVEQSTKDPKFKSSNPQREKETGCQFG
jgi:hypothetical protein